MDNSLKTRFQNFLNKFDYKQANLFSTEETFRKYMLEYLNTKDQSKDVGLENTIIINKTWLYEAFTEIDRSKIYNLMHSGISENCNRAVKAIKDTFYIYLQRVRNGS